MSDHPIQGLMKTAMENLQQMIDVNTIIGDPVETPDGSVILTVSKVGFGFAAGGSEFYGPTGEKHSSSPYGSSTTGEKGKLPFGGGSGGGVSITPIAFLIVGTNGVKILHLDENTHLYEKILDATPQTVEKIQELFRKKKHIQDDNNEKEKIDFDI
ncbi:MAG: sporulation protein YtfJ [Bacillaceae bacterium]|jgi:sporulation protein YtfJ|uniref:GerW family sporulation protein n=1 Tax=Aeribacillus TaxID=1055323 RepID=UPI000E393A31|nr:GerW family sporulation protein [Aeribacillus pallidus]MED1442420.1 GerW family sporulation protein [Aeribacillus composti]REJ20758.1 MAG: sporulation protein YtfJ [Bacillaceae bacterium]BBU40486.1 putative spore protein YtfJ [Aeribacillus pallidus]